jgi:thiamine biosynthesis lipoprotein
MMHMKKSLLLFLALLITITLTACASEDEIIFELTSNGFVASDQDEDIRDFVEIESDVDATIAGTYTVNYNLAYKNINQTLSREVTVQYPSNNCSYIIDANEFQCQKIWQSYLNTIVKLSIFFSSEEQQDSEVIFDHIEDTLSLYNNISDKYKNYQGYTNIKTINDDPTTTHTITQELFDLITFSLEHQEEVNNLFNIALGPVLNIWSDYRDNCNLNNICGVPSLSELEEQAFYTDPSKIVLNEEDLTIRLEENMSIDVGGVSKGYISGIITDYLDSLNLEAYLLNNGESNVSIGGEHPTREEGVFLIGITNPDYNPFIHDVSYFAAVKLKNGDQLVTSGDYQQYYTAEGEIYHHIIHPETLFPERYMRSVSIIFDDPALGDLYSTAIFLMPIEEGLDFVNGIDGLEAIWYDLDGEITFSDNFEDQYLYDLYN